MRKVDQESRAGNGIKLGLWLETTPSGGPEEFGDRVRSLVDAASAAGFSSVWAGESFAFGSVSPLAVIASLIDHTDLGLGALVLLPAWHPLRLAREAASLDHLSLGRFSLGLGIGRPDIQRMFGIDPSTVAAWFDDAIGALRHFWGGGTEFHGTTLRLHGLAQPKPIRPGGPPIWIGGSITRSVRRAAKLGDGYYASTTYPFSLVSRQAEMYKSFSGVDKEPRIAVNRFVVVAPTSEEARATARTHLGESIRRYAAHGSFGASWVRRSGDDSDDLVDELGPSIWLVGDPGEVREALVPYLRLGVEEIHARVSAPGMPLELARQTIGLLGSEVLPGIDSNGSHP